MVSLEEGFLSPELFSKPINKHIYINKKESSHPEFTKLLHPLDLVSERAEFVQQMGDISNNCGRKNNYTNMNYLSRFTNSTLNFLTTEELTKSVTVLRIGSIIPEDYQISIKYYKMKRQKSSQFSSRSFHSLLTI